MNPSSLHRAGQHAKAVLAQARQTMARICGVSPQEVVLTSGGTEALNFLILGLIPAVKGEIIAPIGEHKALLEPVRALEAQGYSIRWVSPSLTGRFTLCDILPHITPSTRLIVLSAANSETGILHDIDGISEHIKSLNIPLVVDAVGLCGKESLALPLGVSGWALSAHKCYGPAGTGAAIIRKPHKCRPLLVGGGQEHGRRSGTEPVIAYAGMAAAFAEVDAQLEPLQNHLRHLRDDFEKELLAQVSGVFIVGREGPRLPNTSCFAIPDWDGEDWVIRLDQVGICVSHGSACSSGAHEPSPSLRAMGLPSWVSRGAIRISVGRDTTHEQITEAVQYLAYQSSMSGTSSLNTRTDINTLSPIGLG